MTMEFVSISKFLYLTKLSCADVLSMLENGVLGTSKDESGRLLIDISSVTPETLARRPNPLVAQATASDLAIFEEVIASEVIAQMCPLIDEAIALAKSWHNETMKSTEEEAAAPKKKTRQAPTSQRDTSNSVD
ncbi:MAG: hypothetical protein IT291_03485 [Deltaproteobacteria bacterium]|nr:hypothetical protein [Deltaproteobacteria bacterium]